MFSAVFISIVNRLHCKHIMSKKIIKVGIRHECVKKGKKIDQQDTRVDVTKRHDSIQQKWHKMIKK